jgi:two-component system cell cycle response regulator DivK
VAKVLVVEDNPANMKLTSLLLHSAGHSVLSAVDAETALRLARGEQPDLILMDIQLPGMDGLTATDHPEAGPCDGVHPGHRPECAGNEGR